MARKVDRIRIMICTGLLLLLSLPSATFAQNPVPPQNYHLLDGARNGACLRRGMRGPEVVALQMTLTVLGHPLAADGIFGPLTEGAVKS